MTKSEDATSGTTVAQTKTITESYKGLASPLSGRGGCGDRGNSKNNSINSAASTSKYYRGEIEACGYVLALKYEKV